jgi:hypothetical protein
MSHETQKETKMQKIAKWEIVTASILLLFMTIYKFSQEVYGPQPGSSILPASINKVIASVMGENELVHAGLYLVIFLLVFSSAIMGYFYENN